MGVAALNQALFNSGASSGSIQLGLGVVDFAFMCIPHRNNAASLAARRPNQYNPSIIQHSVADKTLVVIVKALIFFDKPLLVENFIGSSEIQSAIQQCGVPFTVVVLDFYLLIVNTNK